MGNRSDHRNRAELGASDLQRGAGQVMERARAALDRAGAARVRAFRRRLAISATEPVSSATDRFDGYLLAPRLRPDPQHPTGTTVSGDVQSAPTVRRIEIERAHGTLQAPLAPTG